MADEIKKPKDNTTTTMFKQILSSFESLKNSINEYKIKQASTEAVVTEFRIYIESVNKRMDGWELRIKDIVRGAVKECTEFQMEEYKDKLKKHLESTDPHPIARTDKKNRQNERIKLVALVFGSMFGGGTTVYLLQNIPGILKAIGLLK